MKDVFRTMRSRTLSSIAIVLTLAALCFSVGEGLRLTPFPDLESSSSFAKSSQSAVRTYGPLDVPVQAQKRSKRFAIDLLGPVSTYTHKLFTRRFGRSERPSLTVASVLLVSFPSDRGPPLTA